MNTGKSVWPGGALGKRRMMAGTVVGLLGMAVCVPTWAQGPAKPKAPTVKQGEQAKQAPFAAGAHELTATDLEAFVDGLVCIVDLVFLAAWAVFISGVDNVETLSRSRDPFLYLTQLLGVLGAIGTLLVLFHAFRSWSTAGRWIWSKLFDVALAFACVGFTWFIWHWNLINFNLHY
jgi:hypothetical protein